MPSQTYRWTPPTAPRVYEVKADPATGHVDRIPAIGGTELALPLDVQEFGELRRYKILLPFLPPSKNVYDNSQWKSSTKHKWINAIEKKVAELDMPRNRAPKIGLAAVLCFSSNNRRDPQNYAGPLWNFVPDALVRSRVLFDDRAGAIEFGKAGHLGVVMKADLNRSVPKERRQWTLIGVSIRVPKGKS
jgi:hypothetical protein